MAYVYDLVLNFNKDLYEFFEWRKEDEIYHIKRIHLIKVKSKDFNEIIDHEVIIDDAFLLNVFNKCEYFSSRKVLTIPYAFLITDSYRVMGIICDMHGHITKLSSLLLDEEEDVLEISEKLKITKLSYHLGEEQIKDILLTRNEENIMKYIKKDLDKSYHEKNIAKLKYLYYEYYGKQCDDFHKIYQELTNDLKEINQKHYNLYELIKLSYVHKNA